MPANYNEPEEKESEGGSIADRSSKELIKIAIEKIKAKQPRIALFERYYNGDHPLNFSSEKFTTEFAQRLQNFRDNLCKTVVKAPSDRLEVVGFGSDKNSDVFKESWAAWDYSGMPRLAKRIHRGAFKIGDAFAIVWADDAGKARIYPQNARNCTVFYNDETGKVEFGAKLWRGLDNHVYLTLYFVDRIEKYITRNAQSGGNIPATAAAFVQRSITGEPWPLPNEVGDTCPMFHFGLEDSILCDVIPINDALNKSLADLLVSSESNSIRQRWSSGISYETDPETGKQIIPFEKFAPWVATNDPEGKFGSFDDAVLEQNLKVANDFRNEIAAVAGIPQYYFRLEGGSLPSGEALRKAESRFTSLIKDAQNDFGGTWAEVMRFVLRLDGTGDDAAAGIATQWTPADPMSANETADLVQKKKTIGISETQAMIELGYSDADIIKMQQENSDKAAESAANFSKTFNSGPPIN